MRGGEFSSLVQKRSYSTYNQSLRGAFTNQFVDANSTNKNLRKFVDSNKFDLGYDPNGGHRASSIDRKDVNSRSSATGNADLMDKRMKYKLRDEHQNFKAYGVQRQTNSDAKRIGDTLNSFQKNMID